MASNSLQERYPPHCRYPARWDVPPSQESDADLVWSSQKRWSTGVGHLFGVETRIHLSLWVVLAVLLAIFLAGADYESPGEVIARIGMGLALVMALSGSILVHEMAHAMVARMLHKPVMGVMLHPLGGVALIEIEASPSRCDVLLYLAGPVANLVIAGVLSAFDHSETARVVSAINCDIGIFNLIPIFPLDGSRILREMLILNGSSPTTVDRISWACTRLCCAGAVVYGIITRDISLTVFVLLLWLLARWLLAENLKESAALFEGLSRSIRPGLGSKKRPSLLIMILAFALISTQETASDGDLKITHRLANLHPGNALPLSQHPAGKVVSAAAKKGKSTPSRKAAHPGPKRVQKP
jgi:hypothetical protein